MDKIFQGLNNKQIEAVRAIGGPVLVISGPGSGKTRCLTHRVAYLISQGIKSGEILAITFTNKSAGEMRERIQKLLGTISARPTIGTFHSVCLRILRKEISVLGYDNGFSILDDSDQIGVIKKIMINLEIDPKRFNPRAILSRISRLKTNLVSPEDFEPKDFFSKIVAKAYTDYQAEIRKINGLDFDDLIVLTVRIFKKHPNILEKYQNTWRYILVDEYQDTSHDQYQFIKLLASKNRNIFAIGDDAQCLLPGTKIKTEMGIKNIEDVERDANIISPAGRNQICFTKITAIKKFKYEGTIIEILTQRGHILRSTPNHIIFGKLLPSNNFYITYLMYSQKMGYRIGITIGMRHPGNKKETLGLNVRANQEKSDKMWLLKLSSNRSGAQFWEAHYAFKYGIPTTIFFANRGKGSTPILLTQKHIDKLYNSIPTVERAERLMSDEYISFLHPHHRPQGTIKFDTKRITVNLCYFSSGASQRTKSKFRGARVSINSSDKELKNKLIKAGIKVRNGKSGTWRVENSFRNNGDAEVLADKISKLSGAEISKRALITDVSFDFLPASQIHPHMTVPVFDGQKFINDKVISVKKIEYQGPVYDLDIERTHAYIANNFAVHNSIYAFRDADIKNILNFQKDYPDAKVIFLEQNYRSTKNIITAAQHVISNNQNQVPKELWTENNKGEKILIREALNERDEAIFIIDTIEDLTAQGYRINDCAILYRTHAQSRAIEEALITRGFPYQIVGGIKFYERKEIKDVLAYLRVIANPSDVMGFERIYNIPPRGIGPSTLQKIITTGESNLISATGIIAKEIKGSKQGIGLEQLHKLLKDFHSKKSRKLSKLIQHIVRKTNYEDYLLNTFKKSGSSDAVEDRIENLKELLTVAKKYDALKGGKGIEKFLEEIALLQDSDPPSLKASEGHGKLKDTGNPLPYEATDGQGRIVLMTAHSSKGLEFPVVFIAGMEEGLFPHSRSLIDPKELEEERRLCYVAVTRAKEKLIVSYAKYRHIFGLTEYNLPSRFIGEMPSNILDVRTSMENFYSKEEDDVIQY